MTKQNFRAAKSGSELRRQLLDQFQLESAAQLALVDCAAAALDEARAAEAITHRDGLVVRGSRGLVQHPAVGIGQQARHRLMRALRALDLEK